MKAKWNWIFVATSLLFCIAVGAVRQNAQAQQAPAPGQAAPAGAPAQRGRGGSAYPVRTVTDQTAVDRGKQIFSVNCNFCHGSDARGGEGGPNLVRSQLVLDDQNGELIAPVVQNGRADRGMPKFDLSTQDVQAIAAWIHSIRVGSAAEVVAPDRILVGNAKAGETYFNGAGKCASCHSVTGDLKGIASKYEPRTLQNKMVYPTARGLGAAGGPTAGIPPTMVTVTLASGQKVDGKLDAIDDFLVSLTDNSGSHLTFRRSGDVPKVDVHDPLQAHRDMLRTISDDDIHNLTSYLETLK